MMPPDRKRQLAAVLPAACLVACMYWPVRDAAYRLDDLAWLSLRNNLAAGRSLLWALFSPQAQGTIRPLGDRLWFLLASGLFGLNPVPIHLLALVFQLGNVVLVADVGRRLFSSYRAAGLAAVLWAVSDALATPMVWASALNQVVCAFFFLLAFDALLRWESSQKRIWLWTHVLSLVLSLGALESAVVMPAVVAGYMLLPGKWNWKRLAPSAVTAAVYLATHFVAAPLPKSGPYKLGGGWAMAGAFWHYWRTALGPFEYGRVYGAIAVANLGTAILTVAVLIWLGVCIKRGRWVPLFCLLWFVLTLAPVLPFPQHLMPYYLFLPSIGLAWFAADAVFAPGYWPLKAPAIASLLLYVSCQIPSTLFVRDWEAAQSRDVLQREARLVDSVRLIRLGQPQGPVFLTGFDSDQFWWGMCYGELGRLGFAGLHVMPDAGVPVPPRQWCRQPDFQLSREETARLLHEGNAHLYDVSPWPPERRE